MTESASTRCSVSALSSASAAGSRYARRAARSAGPSAGTECDGAGSIASSTPTVCPRAFNGNADGGARDHALPGTVVPRQIRRKELGVVTEYPVRGV